MSKASLELGGTNWAAKDGNLLGYAVGDSSGKYVPREFTFTRGSNLAATRVAANGLIEKGRENLLLQSNQFDTTWITTNASLTGGQSGYDGTNDAWLFTKSAAGGRVVQSVSTSGVNTYSVYAKAGTLDWISLWNNLGTSYFDLANGTKGSTSSSTTIGSEIESVGNGWYRCSLIFNTSISDVRIYATDTNGSLTSTLGNIYIQDAQLEQGLVATDYIETGATTVQAGLLEDEPRIDYTGGTGSLLLEPNRTQLIPQTEYFNFSGYTTFNSTINDNATTSPEGLQNAAELSGDGTTGQVFFRENISVASTGQYTYSLFAKYKANSDATNIALNLTDFGSGNGTCYFDIENGIKGTESGVTGKIEDYGNGWYRCSITTNFTDGVDLSGRVQFYLADSLESFSFTPNNANAEAYFYGLQVEAGSYPTSYIPNHSGGSVTRSADYVNKTGLGSSVFNNDNLTLFLDFDYNAEGREGSTTKYRIFSDSSQLGIKGINSSSRALQVLASGDFSGTINFNSANASRIKVALRITNGTCELFFNGVKDTETIDVSAAAPYNWDRIAILLDNSMNSSLNQCLGFPTALSDAQCSALTVEGLKEEILTSYIAAVDTLEDGAEARLDTYLQNLEELIV